MALFGCAQNGDPAKVAIVTSDIPHFWRAFDNAAREATAADRAHVYERDYFTPGSAGLRAFIPDHLVSAEHFESVVSTNRTYYAATRGEMARILTEIPRIRSDLLRFKTMYPSGVFPNVYFVVGALNSGGTRVRGTGLVIGSELLSRPSTSPGSAPLTGYERAARGVDAIPGIVLHELVHYNQDDAQPYDLLDASIVEGSADFLGELAGGLEAPETTWRFGCSHEDALWGEFQPIELRNEHQIYQTWLYSFEPAPNGVPPFIGYWIGYRIVQSYYIRRGGAQAVHDILNIKDFPAFLAASGYPAKRPPCGRVAPWAPSPQ